MLLHPSANFAARNADWLTVVSLAIVPVWADTYSAFLDNVAPVLGPIIPWSFDDCVTSASETLIRRGLIVIIYYRAGLIHAIGTSNVQRIFSTRVVVIAGIDTRWVTRYTRVVISRFFWSTQVVIRPVHHIRSPIERI